MLAKLWGYIALYGAHALKIFSFVLLIPHFTSVFDKESWGTFLIIQAFALWLQILVEYGFNLSATRNIAKVKDCAEKVASLVAGVAGAKIFLSIAALFIAFLAILFVHSFKAHSHLVLLGVFFAVSQGFNPVWYFLAREKFGEYAAVDFSTRLMYLFLCLVFIKLPDQINLIFQFGILTSSISNIIGYILIFRQVPLKPPSLSETIWNLKDGFPMFLFVGTTSIYTTLNVAILGLSQSNSLVAIYGTADRIVRAAGGLLDPLNRVIYAKLSHLYHNDFLVALTFLRKSAIVIFCVGLGIFFAGETSAPLIIKILAPNYPEAIIYIKLLLLLIPILALNNIIGLHIMLALNMDRLFNLVFISVSIISVIFMIMLTPRYGANGMGIITILTELLAFLGMVITVWKSRVLINKAEVKNV